MPSIPAQYLPAAGSGRFQRIPGRNIQCWYSRLEFHPQWFGYLLPPLDWPSGGATVLRFGFESVAVVSPYCRPEQPFERLEIDAGRAKVAQASFEKAGLDEVITIIMGDAHETSLRYKDPDDELFVAVDRAYRQAPVSVSPDFGLLPVAPTIELWESSIVADIRAAGVPSALK